MADATPRVDAFEHRPWTKIADVLRSDACFALKPYSHHRSEIRIAAALAEYQFEPRRCLDHVIAEIDARNIDARWFDLDGIAAGGMLASEELAYARTFEPGDRWQWAMFGPTGPVFSTTVPPPTAAHIAQVMHADALFAGSTEPVDDRGVWPTISAPGVYRREHASLVFRSRTTSIIVDPQGLHHAWTTNFGRGPRTPAGERIDGVLMTHSHDDHWHIPSVLRTCDDRHTPVVVPVVARRNILCRDDMASQLRQLGQAVVEAPWWTSTTIGDFAIDVLPFYGEQPLRSGALSLEGLRNWGNCYRLTCPEFSAMVLVDSGEDASGTALEVAQRSVAERGPVDIVLSCCLTFLEGWNSGLPHYALVVALRDLHDMATRRRPPRSMTLGVSGVTELCRAIGCRWFLPYAHGFNGLRVPIQRGALHERDLVARLRAALDGSATRVVSWNPGDSFHWRGEANRVE